MLKVGLTGGIASGKSHVLRRLAGLGFVTVDLDTIAHDVMAPGGPAYAGVVKAFGSRIVAADGTIDRRALGSIVFADAAERRRLEGLVHPRIREAEAAILGGAGDGVAVVDAALLVETGQHLRFARLVVVYCEPEVQLARLMERDGLSAADARARLDAQMAPADKKRFAHFVVDNSGSLAATDAQVDALAAALRTLAARPVAGPRVLPEDAARFIAAGPRQGPRGLSPWDLVAEMAASGALDLARLARRIDPESDRPWYALPARADDAPPETLAGPVALWSVARRPRDEAFTVSAAASVARLTHRDPGAISGAVLAALAAARAIEDGGRSVAAGPRAEWIAAATAWTGAPPAPSAMDPVMAAAGGAAVSAVEPARLAEVARVLAPRA
jgi:dephospho-CoA kinase